MRLFYPGYCPSEGWFHKSEMNYERKKEPN